MRELWAKVKWGWVFSLLIVFEFTFLVGAYIGKSCGSQANLSCEFLHLHSEALKEYQALIAGFMAIVAAFIGAYALYENYNLQTKSNKLAAINVCRANASIMRDHFLKGNITIPSLETANRLLISAEGLALVDPQLTWLALSTASLPLRMVNRGKNTPPEHVYGYARCAALVALLGKVYEKVENDNFSPIKPSSPELLQIINDLRAANYTDEEIGEYVNFITIAPQAAGAEPQPK